MYHTTVFTTAAFTTALSAGTLQLVSGDFSPPLFINLMWLVTATIQGESTLVNIYDSSVLTEQLNKVTL